ncbi:MAG: signal recognition particle-docking protein FtsY [Bacilli bacterium]|nr:signal recognition particle-docking protein FtsY [Bacilli bacterium]
MGFFKSLKEKIFGAKIEQQEKYVTGLDKSRNTFSSKINAIFAKYRQVDENYFQELEDLLISSDVGANLSHEIIEETKNTAKVEKIFDTEKIFELMIEKMYSFYNHELTKTVKINYVDNDLTIVLIVGVNGSGKTTTIAKLANLVKNEGKKVLLVAGDTFRAGAVMQLKLWADRLNIEIVSGKDSSDPSSVIYEGIKKAKNDNYDIVIIDTAGRLQTKINLMNELDKINRVINKVANKNPDETFLVLDATNGQNGIYQAEEFAKVTKLTGIVLTKMDGSSKGGIVLAIKDQLGVPVRYIGLGEKIEDLIEFDLDQYLNGLVNIKEE